MWSSKLYRAGPAANPLNWDDWGKMCRCLILILTLIMILIHNGPEQHMRSSIPGRRVLRRPMVRPAGRNEGQGRVLGEGKVRI